MRALTAVYGISVPTARRLHELGARTLGDAKVKFAQREISPAPGVLEALQYHADLGQPVTVAEARTFVDRVEALAANSLGVRLCFKLCGGFRRGERQGHDIDILYRREDTSTESVQSELLAMLKSEHILVATLRAHANLSGGHELTFKEPKKAKTHFRYAHDVLLTICQTRANKPMRVDFVGVRDREEFSFATLAWSGSTLFQRDLRRYAEKERGWTFNQHGLFSLETGERAALYPRPGSEHDIFDALGLVYRPPFERCA
jgi:DNA polymerase/3'-5' exonuclease PolX